MDSLYEFEAFYNRRPRHWRDFVHGMHHLGREVARTNLNELNVISMAHHGGDSVRGFIARNKLLAEWNG